jgi:hypothetical protein
MNPEFRRQLWLQFSLTRLVLIPALLAICMVAAYLSTPVKILESWTFLASGAFFLLVFGMGVRAAGASVTDEITEATWDQQRMSAMQPWSMAWGKLAGATAYSWYGAALCLLVAVPSALSTHDHVLSKALSAVLLGVFFQAVMVAVNLQLVKIGGTVARRGGLWLLVLMGLLLFNLVPSLTRDLHQITWWNMAFSSQGFTIASLVLCVACALVSCWRSMAEVLAVRQLPWGWPALALVTTTYLAGFKPENPALFFAGFGLIVCTLVTYGALVTEPQTRPLWQRIITQLQSGRWVTALQLLPRWPTTLCLSAVFALVCMVVLDAGFFAVTTGPRWGQMAQQPIAFVLLLGRDCCIALFFAFSPTGRRPMLAFLVSMFVLYGVLPWLFFSAAQDSILLGLVLPWSAPGLFGLLGAVVQLAVAWALLQWRWKTSAT